jgi:hypothetical protein
MASGQSKECSNDVRNESGARLYIFMTVFGLTGDEPQFRNISFAVLFSALRDLPQILRIYPGSSLFRAHRHERYNAGKINCRKHSIRGKTRSSNNVQESGRYDSSTS